MPALKRYELSEAQLQRIAPLLPGKKGDPGRSGTDNRRFARSTPSGRPPTEPCNGLCNRVVGSQALQRLVFKGDQGLKLVLPDRIELSTSPLPRECSTTELRQPVLQAGGLVP